MRLVFFLCAALIGLGTDARGAEPLALDPSEIATLESAGTMRDIAAGAFEKTIWRDHKRSELIAALRAIPPESPLRSIHDIKRRLLLSQTDASLIENDEKPTTIDNLFITRLKKLQEMGLYEDALKLYTDHVDTPRDARLAETGLILMTHQRGLATACLEEKVIATQFEGDAFFALMDSICSFTLGQTDDPPVIEQSPLLTTALGNEEAKFLAKDLSLFTAMTPLEMAILKSEGQISYTDFKATRDALAAYPSRVLMTFLEDKTLPGEQLLALQVEMAERGYVSVKKLPAWKEAHIIKVDFFDKKKTDEEAANKAFWASVTPKLNKEPALVNLTPYGAALIEARPDVNGSTFYKALAVIAAAGYDVPPAWCEKLAGMDSPAAALYAESLHAVQACEPLSDKAVDNAEDALAALPAENQAKLLIILGLLAPKSPEYDQFRQIYDKQFPLTAQDDYVMHRQDKSDEMPKTQGFQGFGAALLHALSTVTGKSGENINPPVLQITVNSLLDGGLENDARQIAREVLVGILRNNKKNLGENQDG